MRAAEIAETAEFFSFGTNYLTRTTFGISCDDAGSFLPDYRRSDILEHNSFMNIDVRGVGELVRTATKCGGAVPSDNQAEHLRRARQ